jgi:hypothetical protein
MRAVMVVKQGSGEPTRSRNGGGPCITMDSVDDEVGRRALVTADEGRRETERGGKQATSNAPAFEYKRQILTKGETERQTSVDSVLDERKEDSANRRVSGSKKEMRQRSSGRRQR